MKKSAGILLFRRLPFLEVLLVHPGGPFWKNKDLGAWTIPKGEIEDHEDPLPAAIREFREETGLLPEGSFIPLPAVRQKSGKWIEAWMVEGNFEPRNLQSNFFEMEWPPRSGKFQSFPEIDRAAWFTIPAAREKINPAQLPFLDAAENLE